MTTVSIAANNSITKRALYNPNQRVNAKMVGLTPGLEDDILVYPKAIIMLFRELFCLESGEYQWLGGEISNFNTTTINTKKGGMLKDDEIYFLESLTLQPTPQAFWGFYEIELVSLDSDLVDLQFFNISSNSSYQQSANTRKVFQLKIYENYNNTASFPTLTSGRIKWFEYKKDNAFGSIISVNKIINSIKIPKNKNGTLFTVEDFIIPVRSVNGQTGDVVLDPIVLGDMCEDPFDQLDPSRYKIPNGQTILRTGIYATLWNLVHKNITGMTASTDRISCTNHGCIEGQLVKFSFTGGGVTALTNYYVRNPTTNDFQISSTSTGPILDLTSSQTGEMITNVEYGFGDGSTTYNVPDRRGIFARGAGVHGTRNKMVGGNYDGGAVGYAGQDQIPDHAHAITYNNVLGIGGGAGGYWFGAGGTGTFYVSIALYGPNANGANGTPRVGSESTPAYIAVKYKVRVA
ncbi:hypothetical protein [Leptospira interrogans]|uniref:hypothetical protein n=1 Tax=Leptospira interrogans TaxID=173 RepID=UPI00031BC16A|nr:hypothetical protein [Leptospira interrogans]UMQ60559.1 phage tail protein [Leptospira interrogans]